MEDNKQVENQENTQENNTNSQEVETQQGGEKTYSAEEFKKAVEEASKESSNKTKRELSKTLGVNLFDENETNTFIDGLKNKVDKEKLTEYEQKLQEAEEVKQKYEDLTFENVVLKNGVKDDYKDKVKKLSKVEIEDGKTPEEAVKKVLDEFPMFKQGSSRQVGININDDNSTVSGTDKYIQDNYSVDSSGRLIPKKR